MPWNPLKNDLDTPGFYKVMGIQDDGLQFQFAPGIFFQTVFVTFVAEPSMFLSAVFQPLS